MGRSVVLVGLVLFGMVGRDYVLNVGRGYVIHNHDSVSREGKHRAARAAKKLNTLK